LASSTGSNPEDEYAGDQYADYDAEDREQPSGPAEIPGDEPEDDVLEQRQEVPYAATSANGRYATGRTPAGRAGSGRPGATAHRSLPVS
jgi:hypothetical protein